MALGGSVHDNQDETTVLAGVQARSSGTGQPARSDDIRSTPDLGIRDSLLGRWKREIVPNKQPIASCLRLADVPSGSEAANLVQRSN